MPTSSLPNNGSLVAVARYVVVAALLVVVAACASSSRAPVEERGAYPSRPAWSILAAPPVPAAPPRAAPGADPDWRPSTHTVKRGDTLHQIALDYGLDYRELAAWNNIDNPNLILVGQVLRVTASDGAPVLAAAGVTIAPLRTTPPVGEAKAADGKPLDGKPADGKPADGKPADGKPADGKPAESRPTVPSTPIPAVAPTLVPSRNSETYKTLPKAVKQPYSERAMREIARAAVDVPAVAEVVAAPAPVPVAPASRVEPRPEVGSVASSEPEGDEKLNWVWPSKGKIVGSFSETANLKGIDIAGTAGQPVVASASGTVVYAGTGLRGYGKLIIVKHNKTYLSAYAHNREILVKEGQVVGRGEKIAEMGNSDAADVKLHFEIRRLGKPMDPARYLPPA